MLLDVLTSHRVRRQFHCCSSRAAPRFPLFYTNVLLELSSLRATRCAAAVPDANRKMHGTFAGTVAIGTIFSFHVSSGWPALRPIRSSFSFTVSSNQETLAGARMGDCDFPRVHRASCICSGWAANDHRRPRHPGHGKWENNFAIAFAHRSGETAYEVPVIDLNYGVGDHIQLTIQTAPVISKRSQHGVIAGIGEIEAAIKWRFIDQATSGFDMSIFPRVIFNITHSSVRRGLAEDGTRFQIPFQAAISFGQLHLDAEVGPKASSVGPSEWLSGIVIGADLTHQTMLMAELHDESRMDFSRDVLTINVGLRHEFTEHYILIVSMGDELRSPDQTALISYFGMQFVY